jgi:hypothetical protein
MMDGEQTGLVLRDGHGHYYLLTNEALTAARISGEQAAALEDTIGDVRGYFTPIPIPHSQIGSLLVLGTVPYQGAHHTLQVSSFKPLTPR